MVTKVGLQKDFSDALYDLIELDFDAIEAYDAAINRLDNTEYRNKLSEFRDDHKRHVSEVSGLLKKHGKEAPTGPSAKQWLAKGKVVLANLIGDNTILAAMKTNEDDTNTAYERVNSYDDKWQDSIDILKRGWDDEKKHRAWIEKTLS